MFLYMPNAPVKGAFKFYVFSKASAGFEANLNIKNILAAAKTIPTAAPIFIAVE